MTRKAMSIIGRIIGLLLVIALAFGITWCTTHWSKVEAEWNKIFNKAPQQEQPNEPDQPTPDKPSEEQINLDGLYYINVDGDYSFVQIRDYSPETQIGSYGIVGGCMKDSQICLFKDWESEIELEPFHTTEDDKYLHVFVTDQVNSNEYKIAIYDKTSKTLYYDFSNGQQIPGETYEDQLLSEMIKFDEYEISDSSSEVCEHDWVEDLSYVPTAPSCGEYWDKQYKCSKCNETKLETNGPLPHDYVNGVCTRCGESDPNYVEEVASIDGLYYGVSTDGTVNIFQIEGAKFVQFIGYTQNGDESIIYLPQDWETYIEFGFSLEIEENDTQIICGISEYMERYKDNPELYEVYSNYFVYDKQTKELCVGKNKFVLTRIDSYNILPYEEPRIYVENDVLHMTDMTGIDGTYNVYYQFMSGSYEGEYPDSYFEEQVYVAGNVSEFDLSLLVNRESVPMLKGRTYEIRVVFATVDGFLIRGYESIQYTVPDNSPSRYEHYCMMTDDMFENMDKAVINCTWKGQEYEVELTWADHINGYFYSWADAGIIISKVNDEYLIYTDGNIDASEFEINSAIGYFSNLGFETSTII